MRENMGVYRGKTKDGEWVEGGLLGNKVIVSAFSLKDEDFELKRYLEVDRYSIVLPETVGEWTGMYDCTKWEELTLEEQTDFYNKHHNDNERTIKWQTVDDARSEWKGKRIFEGDIVNCSQGCPHKVIFLNEYAGQYCGGMPAFYLSGLGVGYAWTGDEEHIGNCVDNPELVKE